MPGMQWLGSIPAEDVGSQIARAIPRMAQNLALMSQYRRQEERESRQEKLELDKLDYNKKKAAADMIINAAKSMPAERAAEFLNEPQVKDLLEDLGMPVPKGLAAKKEPTWRQQELIKSLREGFDRGRVTVQTDMGDYITKDIATVDDVYDVLSKVGLGEEHFKDQISKWSDTVQVMKGRDVITIPRPRLPQAQQEGWLLVPQTGKITSDLLSGKSQQPVPKVTQKPTSTPFISRVLRGR